MPLDHVTSPPRQRREGESQDILDAIRTLKHLEHEGRQANPDERQALLRFGVFGPVALSLFPDPVTGSYKDPAWQALGETLQMLLSPEEYERPRNAPRLTPSIRRPTATRAMHEALARLGVPREAIVLNPACGTGNFMALAPQAAIFWGLLIFTSAARRQGRFLVGRRPLSSQLLDMLAFRCTMPPASSLIPSSRRPSRILRRSTLSTSLPGISPMQLSGTPILFNFHAHGNSRSLRSRTHHTSSPEHATVHVK